MPFISIKKQKELNNIFRNKLKEIEEEVYPLSDPSILKGKVNAQLEILDQNLSALKTNTNNEMKQYNNLKDKFSTTLADTKDNVIRPIQAYFDEFRKTIPSVEDSIVRAIVAFYSEYEGKIEEWKDDFIDKIKKIDNRLLDKKFKFNGKEHSLREVVLSHYWYLYAGRKDEHYLTMGQIGQAII